MPHLNKLCRSGRRFTRAYAQSSHSNYADPALFSSLYPLRTRYHHYYSRSDPWPKTLLYDVLKSLGYATALYSSQNEGWGNMDAFLESDHWTSSSIRAATTVRRTSPMQTLDSRDSPREQKSPEKWTIRSR